jgi:hypothetical protein
MGYDAPDAADLRAAIEKNWVPLPFMLQGLLPSPPSPSLSPSPSSSPEGKGGYQAFPPRATVMNGFHMQSTRQLKVKPLHQAGANLGAELQRNAISSASLLVCQAVSTSCS